MVCAAYQGPRPNLYVTLDDLCIYVYVYNIYDQFDSIQQFVDLLIPLY